NPAAIQSGFHAAKFIEGVVAIFLEPELARFRIERHAESIADAVSEDFLEVRPHFAAHRGASAEERIVWGTRTVVVQTENHPGQMRVIRFRTAELIILDDGTRAGFRRAARQVLQETA